ncbi:PD40 domain-containing protein [Nonomuraea jiangxiensis]|uniref:WD40-like Beta Propeller Repeat n=1 Tax=Nonomuraea jiangxiensis TaxID=633440 RepID=A0A1G7YUJ6_9ACTN|nr:PD40 domain-containing protein [Nonomuraea jiangxiensis]SDH00193.1 WD40-like Beta Propeller Repeat [Nonomuraea jiangxiensis]
MLHLGTALALTAVLAAPPAQPPVGKLPDTTAKIVAKMSGRPVQLSFYSYFTEGGPRPGQRAWDPAKRAFVKIDGQVTVSPDERWQAVHLQDRRQGQPSVRFVDRRTGKATEVELPVRTDPKQAGQYLNTLWPTWSPDGRTLLVNVFEPGSEPRSEGIVLIDVPSLKPRFIRIEKALITVGGFQWTRDSKGVVVRWGKNGKSVIRQYDLEGAVKRTWKVRGRPASHGLGTFSPSGRRFLTACHSLESSACVWDTATGKAVTRIKVAHRFPVFGWYDEKHLLLPVRDGFGVVNLKGKVVETLVKVGEKENFYPRFDARGKH